MANVGHRRPCSGSRGVGAGVPGWPTSMWMIERPWASRVAAARITSMTMKLLRHRFCALAHARGAAFHASWRFRQFFMNLP